MTAVCDAKSVFRVSAAVLALVWFGQSAMAQDAVSGDEDVVVVDETLVDEPVLVDDGSVEEPVFVSVCGGCELENMAGGPEVQRGPHAVQSGSGDTVVTARSGGNACASGALAQMWICTVQNDSWRD